MALDYDTLKRLADLNDKISDCKRKIRDCEKKIDQYEAAIKKVQKAEEDNSVAIEKERELGDYKEELFELVRKAAQGDPQYRSGIYPVTIRTLYVYPRNTIGNECYEAAVYWTNKITELNNKIASYRIRQRNYEYERSLL